MKKSKSDNTSFENLKAITFTLTSFYSNNKNSVSSITQKNVKDATVKLDNNISNDVVSTRVQIVKRVTLSTQTKDSFVVVPLLSVTGIAWSVSGNTLEVS